MKQISRKYMSRLGLNDETRSEVIMCVREYIAGIPDPVRLTRKDFLALDGICLQRVKQV